MSTLFTYIATRTTNDPYVGQHAINLQFLARDVSEALVALAGGYVRVGQLAFFPLQRTVPDHLLCDGKEVPKAAFPELYSFLGDTEGTPVDPTNFVLPNFVGAASFVPAATAVTETVNAGTVSSPPPTDPDIPAWNGDIYNNASSGGRFWADELFSI